MKYRFSHRINNIEEMVFRKLDAVREEYKNILDLSRGLPMGMPPREILSELTLRLKIAENHIYTDWKGLKLLREEVAYFYKDRYNVELDPDTEIQILIGSKEGLSALMLACVEKDDEVLVPDPSFPAFRNAVLLSDATPKTYSLTEKNAYKPDIKKIESDLSGKEKIIILNYPHSPTGAVCDLYDFKEYANFANKHGLIICYDAVYRELSFKKHPTLLQIDGCKDFSVEITSLSKTFDMCGWRIGYMVGSKYIIEQVRKIKSAMDVGQFIPIQYAAIMGMKMSSYIDVIAQKYKLKAEKAYKMLTDLNYDVFKPEGAFFLWSKIPASYKKSEDFIKNVYKTKNVLLMPGSGFGKNGEGFFRISLTPDESVITNGINSLGKMENYL